jgi:hypothetical protein
MTDAEQRKSRGCFKWLLWGCLAVIVTLGFLVVLVVVNLDKIVPEEVRQGVSDYVDSRKEAFQHMGELNTELAPMIDAESFHTSISFGPGEGHDHLVVNILNANLDDKSQAGMEAKAREIALFAAENYADLDAIDTVVIVFISQFKAGVTITSTNPFPYPLEELLGGHDQRNEVREVGDS